MAKKKKLQKKKKGGVLQKIRILGMVLVAFIFLPTTIMMLFALLPTVVAALIDRSGKLTKALTVGSMNLAGTMPFLLQLWTTGHSVENALVIISDPRTIIVIYCAAGIGYLIEWAMSGLVGSIMVQSSGARLKEIKKRQLALIARWGEEVTGDIPLDTYGFPVEEVVQEKDKKKTEPVSK